MTDQPGTPTPEDPPTTAPATGAPALAVSLRPPGGWDDDRGDVPGWVLVTLMTAGLVLALWAVAGPALVELFETAIGRVSGIGG